MKEQLVYLRDLKAAVNEQYLKATKQNNYLKILAIREALADLNKLTSELELILGELTND